MRFFKDFRDFAVKGNVLDMAVGIIIGVAFNKIVNSLVNDIIMPPIGLALGKVDFKNLQVVIMKGAIGPTGGVVGEVAIRYGLFANTVIEFLIVAISVFIVVKFMNRLIRRREAVPASAGP
ncbi:MAG TPA: large conductance mechanosensitive channel protein MscL [Phycisphaerae bacterium]|nr:large conductance mechanosensitive channel protein MscL [Phycisphaerae bacterium]